MAIQGIEAMQTVVQQMKNSASQAAGVEKTLPPVTGFGGELKAALSKINDMQQSSRAQAQKFELGVEGVSLNDTMVDLQKSSVALNMGIQVRNRLVSAYHDIMSMHM